MSPSSRSTTHRRIREDPLRYAAGVLICPRCHVPLTSTGHKTGIAWRCQKCAGQSLNFSQFRHLVPEHGANGIWLQAMAHPLSPMQQARCPECLADMDAVLIPFRGGSVELDICRPCQRLWLDRQEAAAVPSLTVTPSPGALSTMQGPAPAPPLTPQQQRDQLFALLEACGDANNRRRDRRNHRAALYLAIPGGIMAFFCAWPMPEDMQFRIALVTGSLIYIMRVLWR